MLVRNSPLNCRSGSPEGPVSPCDTYIYIYIYIHDCFSGGALLSDSGMFMLEGLVFLFVFNETQRFYLSVSLLFIVHA